ncbi:MAG: Hsp20/alpha crystallin family protein [Gammaproteobacteria bacterium]
MKNQILIGFVIILLMAFGVQTYLSFKLNDKVNRLSGRDSFPESPEMVKPQIQKFLPPPDDALSERRSSYEEMDRMRKNKESMFEDSFSRFHLNMPDADLRETADDYIVTVNLPGIDEPTLKVSVEDRILTISVKTEKTVEESSGDDDNYRRKERFVGEFNRVMTLPGEVDAEKLKTRYKNGVLTVIIPKK